MSQRFTSREIFGTGLTLVKVRVRGVSWIYYSGTQKVREWLSVCISSHGKRCLLTTCLRGQGIAWQEYQRILRDALRGVSSEHTTGRCAGDEYPRECVNISISLQK
jgi:hypothetical protein